jgi:hypothetical protein
MHNNLSTLPIVLRLLRFNTGAKSDDLIKIYREDYEDDSYKIVFVAKDADTHSGKTTHESIRFYTGEELDVYLNSLFVLLTRDDDPYEKLQISAPGFPCIMLTMDQLKKSRTREEIMNVLPLLTNFWKE